MPIYSLKPATRTSLFHLNLWEKGKGVYQSHFGLLTKSSLEKFSRFMCADYDGFVWKCLLFRAFEKNDF